MAFRAVLLIITIAASQLQGQDRAVVAEGSADELPHYASSQQVDGLIRISGSSLAGLVSAWEDGFKKYHPGVLFHNSLLSGDAAIGALEAGAADLAANGREPVLTEFLSFSEVFNNDGPFQVTVATGSYEVLGRTWAPVMFVNKNNPLQHLTLKQLDQIFGAERTGGYAGYKWVTTAARAESDNIRTWGQLGLTGRWANQPIHTYGYAPTGMSNFFELTVFHGGTKWNPNLRQYVETSAKQATDHLGTTDQMMDDLSGDEYGIAWAGLAHAEGKAGVKQVAVSESPDGPFLYCTEESVRNRMYPLTRSIYFQLNRPPGMALQPRIKEFLRYVLSREGQAVVQRQGEYLPLTGAELDRQRHSLD